VISAPSMNACRIASLDSFLSKLKINLAADALLPSDKRVCLPTLIASLYNAGFDGVDLVDSACVGAGDCGANEFMMYIFQSLLMMTDESLSATFSIPEASSNKSSTTSMNDCFVNFKPLSSVMISTKVCN